MKTMVYLLQVSACTGIFYCFYYLFLRRLTFFKLNRWYLMGTLLLSFIIPAIHLPISTTQPPVMMQPVININRMLYYKEPAIAVIQHTLKQPTSQAFDWVTPVKLIYIAVTTASVIHLFFTLLIFILRLRRNRELMQIGKVRVLKSNRKLSNSSFLNIIFINDDRLEPDEIKQIIIHEMLHVKLMHSADRLVARITQIILWFNPFAYCYLHSIEENHEFEVDHIAAGEDNKGMYVTLLYKLAVSGQSHLFHSFSKVPLKSRIKMLFNKPTPKMKKIIYMLILPIVVVSCLAFANLKPEKSSKSKRLLISKNSVASIENSKKMPETENADTIKYRQKRRGTPRQIKAEDRSKAEFDAYKKTDEYKQRMLDLKEVSDKTLNFKVKEFVNSGLPQLIKDGYKIVTNNKEYILETGYGQNKELKNLLKPGDIISVKVKHGMFSQKLPITITADLIKKDGKEIFRAEEADKTPKYAFLYEANRIRFTDGQVTNIKKYPDGKWKSAVVEVVNGYKIKFNIKPSAPEFKNIEWGDHVTFRFVHEIKTGAKEYTVNDWVSMAANAKDYGIKNPDFFYRFYEKI